MEGFSRERDRKLSLTKSSLLTFLSHVNKAYFSNKIFF